MSTLSTNIHPRDLDRTLIDPPDPAWIMLPAVALIGLGVTMIYSASADLGGTPASWQFWKDPGLKQLVFVPPALFLMWLVSHIPYRFWAIQRYRLFSPVLVLLLVTLLLLVGVLVAPASLAPRINGARRWFRLPGGVSLQPSELAKLTLVLILAALLADPRFRRCSFLLGMVPLVALVALVDLPVGKEDFGTAFLIASVAGLVIMAGGTRLWHLLLFIPPVAAGGVLFVLRSPNRLKRVQEWLHGQHGSGEIPYQIRQSLMAIASGSWLGRGLGDGIQKFGYLPEDTTDCIFPIVCEELGLVGGLIVLGIFLMLLWQLRRAMVSATDLLGQLIVLGVMLTIGFQAAINIAVVTGWVPPKGIALPFVSAGGSGLIIMSIALGLAASVARTTKKELERTG